VDLDTGTPLDSLFKVKTAATLGLDVNSKLRADHFEIENGAKLAIYGISTLPLGQNLLGSKVETAFPVNMPSTVTAEGDFYKADLSPNGTKADLTVEVKSPFPASLSKFSALEQFRLSRIPGAVQR
jgi:hypothetical protein